MNAASSIPTLAPIQINDTILRLLNGAAVVQDIIAERRHSRAEQLANEDGYLRRRREQSELLEAFQASLGSRDFFSDSYSQ